MERNRKKRNYKKERGITLVALIITIIVMLILVAVTVRVVVESDIIGVAEKAAESKETGELKDQIAMKIGEWQVDRYTKEPQHDQLIGYLEELNNEEAGVTVAGTSKIATITKGDTVITVNEAGEIITGQVDTLDLDSEGKPVKEIPVFDANNKEWYINNAEQFKFFADYVNGDLTAEEQAEVTEAGLTITANTTVYLMANLDLGARPGEGATVEAQWETEANEARNWTPIGKDNSTHKFEGTFEGNGHVISGAYVSTTGNCRGIFGNVTNTIQNLIVKDSYIKSTGGATGGIVGALREGEILNCHNINTTVITGNYAVAGIVGQSATNTKIINCSNTGNISSTNFEASNCAGGIVGLHMGSVEKCYNSGEITGKGDKCGGIVGEAKNESKTVECINKGLVQGNTRIGGITGNLFGTIEKCYNEGTITGTAYAIGGICGAIGNDAEATIKNTYNIEDVIAESSVTEFVGGILGVCYEGAISVDIKNNYNIGTIIVEGTDTTDIGGAIGIIVTSESKKAERNYYLSGKVVNQNGEPIVDAEGIDGKGNYRNGIAKEDDDMKLQDFVDALNDLGEGLTQNVWVKTSEYPALIGM